MEIPQPVQVCLHLEDQGRTQAIRAVALGASGEGILVAQHQVQQVVLPGSAYRRIPPRDGSRSQARNERGIAGGNPPGHLGGVDPVSGDSFQEIEQSRHHRISQDGSEDHQLMHPANQRTQGFDRIVHLGIQHRSRSLSHRIPPPNVERT